MASPDVKPSRPSSVKDTKCSENEKEIKVYNKEKKTMKKKILTLLAVAALTTASCMAQDEANNGRPPRGPRGDMMEKMKTELSLSDEQAAQLKEVFSSMRPGKNGERPTREEMEKKRTETEAKVKKILTEEQYAKYQKMRSERRPPRERK